MSEMCWSADEVAAFAAIRAMRLLNEGRHDTYFVLPNGRERRYDYVTVNWLGDVLTPTYTRLLFREFPTLIAEGDEGQQAAARRLVERMDLPGLCLPTAVVASYAGWAAWKLYWSPLLGGPAARLWGARDGEFLTFEYLPTDPSRPHAVNFWYTVAAQGGDTVMLRERHALLAEAASGAPSGVRMTTTAHKCDGGVPLTDIIPLEAAWPRNAPLPPAEAVTHGLSELPVALIHSGDRNGDRVGDSDYTRSLISLQKNLNKLVALRQLVIDLSEQPQLIVPPEYLDEAGNVDWSTVRLRIKYDGEDGVEIKTVNWSGNLENSGAQWEFYRREFQALSGIAPGLLGFAEAGGESGYARRLGMVNTEAEVGTRRRAWERAFTDTLRIAMAMENVYGGSSIPPVERIKVSWPPAIPENQTEFSAAVLAEFTAGARSLESAVRLLNPEWGAQEIRQEVARLQG